MTTIDITSITMKSGNQVYTTYLLDIKTLKTYKVVTGGNSCLARCKSELENRGVEYWDIKEISPNVKSHKKYFTTI